MRNVRSRKPDNEYINNCKLQQFLTKLDLGLLNNGGVKFELLTYKKRGQDIFIQADVMSKVKLDGKLTQFDLAVMDSVYTLYIAGNYIISVDIIVKTMSGNMDLDVTEKKREAVIASLEKLIRIRITLNCEDELKARNRKPVKIEDYLMPLRTIMIEDDQGDDVVLGYELKETPAVYQYAEQTHQIINVPVEIMRLKGTLSETDEVILLKRYLIKRIEQMKDKKNRVYSRTISYEWWDKDKKEYKGIIPVMGYEPKYFKNWRKKKARIHHIISELLQVYTDEGYIKGFKVIQCQKTVSLEDVVSGQSIEGYRVELHED